MNALTLKERDFRVEHLAATLISVMNAQDERVDVALLALAKVTASTIHKRVPLVGMEPLVQAVTGTIGVELAALLERSGLTLEVANGDHS